MNHVICYVHRAEGNKSSLIWFGNDENEDVARGHVFALTEIRATHVVDSERGQLCATLAKRRHIRVGPPKLYASNTPASCSSSVLTGFTTEFPEYMPRR